MEITLKLRQEIARHISNPDEREGEENLSLLVAQEVGRVAAGDREAMAAELDATIEELWWAIGRRS